MTILRKFAWPITTAVLLLAWGGFSWLRYSLADARLWDCYEHIRRAVQRSICINDALEDRSSVITWGIGLPLVLIIGCATVMFMVGRLRGPKE